MDGVCSTVRRSVFLGSEYDLFLDFNGREVRVQRSAFEGIKGISEGAEVGLSFLNPKFYPVKDKEEAV